jgi:hypothetical protein
MTRTASALTFAAILAACLAGAHSASWWLALGLVAFTLPLALAQRSPALSRTHPPKREPAQAPADNNFSALVPALLDLGIGLTIGFALGRVMAWLVFG